MSACDRSEALHLHALRALPSEEARELETHLEGCAECRQELEALRETVASFASWPADVLRPARPLWDRIAARIGSERSSSGQPWRGPEWRAVADGIQCKLLSTDHERRRVSMLVRLAPGAEYPPHRHAGIEELHLLDGVLLVDDQTLHPGDYLRSEIDTSDARVYSETGCTCVLVTSIDDELG